VGPPCRDAYFVLCRLRTRACGRYNESGRQGPQIKRTSASGDNLNGYLLRELKGANVMNRSVTRMH
jgi:hypothetical protein